MRHGKEGEVAEHTGGRTERSFPLLTGYPSGSGRGRLSRVMQKHVFLALASVGVAVAAVQVSACGLSVNGLGASGGPDSSLADVVESGPKMDGSEASQQDQFVADGGDASDGETEAATCNAQNCGGTCCGTTCLPQQGCGGCDASAFCPFSTMIGSAGGYCVSDCTTCSPTGGAANVTCWSCATGDASAGCFGQTSKCPTMGSGACGCTQANDCPGKSQVCANQVCLTCGQPGTDKGTCPNGTKCNAPSGACE